MESRLTQKYLNLINGGLILEKEILALRKYINRRDVPWASKQALLDTVEKVQPRITEEQHRKGLTYLLNLQETKTGKKRKHAPFTPEQVELLKTATHHTLAELEQQHQNGYAASLGLCPTLPVYVAHSPKGMLGYVGKAYASGLDFERVNM